MATLEDSRRHRDRDHLDGGSGRVQTHSETSVAARYCALFHNLSNANGPSSAVAIPTAVASSSSGTATSTATSTAAARATGEGNLTLEDEKVLQHEVWIVDEGWSKEEQERVQNLLDDNDEKCAIPSTAHSQLRSEDRIWDLFYSNHGTGFFKDRHYLEKAFPNDFSMQSSDGSGEGLRCNRTMMELGCGVGNALFPFLEENLAKMRASAEKGDDADDEPMRFRFSTIYGLDLSRTAIELMKQDERFVEYNRRIAESANADATEREATRDDQENADGRMVISDAGDRVKGGAFGMVCDLTTTMPPECIGAADVTSLLFCLSAIDPAEMPTAASNVASALKPNGVLVFRDFGRYDEVQLKLGTSRGKRVKENFYQKHDGTKCFYFTTEDVRQLFVDAGFEVLELDYIRRIYVNHGTRTKRRRVWVQGRFRKLPLVTRMHEK